MRNIAYTSYDYRNVPPLLARPSGGDPEAVVVRSELEELLDAINLKLDTLELATQVNARLAATIKRFTLTGGVSRVVTENGINYTYTLFTIYTGFVDDDNNPTIDFEDFAMSSALAPYTNEGWGYEFRKELPDRAIVEFQSVIGVFPDNKVRISLIRIPGLSDPSNSNVSGSLVQPEDYFGFVNDAFDHFDSQWVADYVNSQFPVSLEGGEQRINFKNGRWITPTIAGGRLVIDWPDVDVIAKSVGSTYSQGSTDTAVVYQLQRLLLETGDSTNNSFDGVFNTDLTNALNAFKTRQGLNPNGIVDGNTWGYLSNDQLPNWHV